MNATVNRARTTLPVLIDWRATPVFVFQVLLEKTAKKTSMNVDLTLASMEQLARTVSTPMHVSVLWDTKVIKSCRFK